MERKLRDYQSKAVETIYNFFQSDKLRGKMYLSIGLGKTIIIISVIKKVLEKGPKTSILILSSRREICEQIKYSFEENMPEVRFSSSFDESKYDNILITTYQALNNNKAVDLTAFDLVVCDEAQFLKSEKYRVLFECNKTKYFGILQENISSEGWFSDAECIFKYTLRDAIEDGYIRQYNESITLENLLTTLLTCQGFKNIQNEVLIKTKDGKNINLDMLAEKDESFFAFEVKVYRGVHNPPNIINDVLNQVLYYKQTLENIEHSKKTSFIIVMLCKIDKSLKQEIFKRFDIEIWDISNLIYLCNGNRELSNLLMNYTSYSLIELDDEKPINQKKQTDFTNFKINESTFYISKQFQQRLDDCKAGKNKGSDKTYEKICTDIIKYLFESEFSRISEQHKTDDDMFRMDLLCSLKGSTEFWKFLIQFYCTKFVVFEYKNYSDYISQNLIYITEKYLFPVALRNVAFIISRVGFDPNAEKAALGCLKENGKLIASLNDEDLINMVVMKENGEEPSDYLLNKVEQLLMSVSK